jgi:hypothetical protein
MKDGVKMTQRNQRWNFIPIDGISNAGITISHDHHKIHEGHKFIAWAQQNILAGQTYRFSFITPSDTYIHYQRSEVSSSVDKLTIRFYQNGVVDTEGDLVATSNRDLNSDEDSGVIIRRGDTYTNVGTQIVPLTGYLPGSVGVGQNRTGGTSGGGEEIILKPNTVYVYKIVNGSDSANLVSINWNWYKDDDY